MANRIQFSEEELLLLHNYTNSSDITDILNRFGGDIDKLKSYVKWLYKYGGTGSKGNGGGGSGTGSNNWSVKGTIDNQPIGDTVLLSENNSKLYDINLSISKPGEYTFTAYVYTTDPKKPAITIKLNEDNRYRYEGKISLIKNTNVKIVVVNNFDDTDDKEIFSNCIATVHNISTVLVDNNDNEFSNISSIYYNSLTNGLMLKINHEIFINGNDVVNPKINLNIIGGKYNNIPVTIPLHSTGLNDNESNVSYINLYDILDLSDNSDDIYDTYSIIGKLTYSYKGNPQEGQIFINTTIVPNDVYLKIVPIISKSIVYKNQQKYTQEEIDAAQEGDDAYGKTAGELKTDTYVFSNKNIPLNITAFSTYDSVLVSIFENNDKIFSQVVSKNVQTQINLQLAYQNNISEHVFTFVAEETGGSTKEFVRYMYLIGDDGSIKWFDNNDIHIYRQTYFRGTELNNNTGNINVQNFQYLNPNFRSQGFAEMNVIENNSINIYHEININEVSSNSGDILISLGIQYGANNVSSEDVICDFIFNSSRGANTLLSLKQNKVIIGNDEREIFVPKELNYDTNNISQYHLLNILIREVNDIHQLLDNERHYELIVFIDGYIENAFGSYFSTSNSTYLTDIIAYEGNYALNLLDVTYINFARYIGGIDDTSATRQISDIDIVQYYYKYINVDNEEYSYFTTLKTIFSNFSYDDIVNQDSFTTVIKVNNIKNSADFISSITSANHHTPIMVLQLNNETNSNVFFNNYFCHSYQQGENYEDQTPLQINNFIYIDENNTVYEHNESATFALQGSSTGKFKSKNFTVTMKDPEAREGEAGYSTLMTPNFKTSRGKTGQELENAYLTFLPEHKILFKADSVDSTHANNTSAGLFINKNTTKFADSRDIHANVDEYKPYIKNCLVGFPILIFFALKTQQANELEFYYVGIYNCNLGRDSLLNLGYYNLDTTLNNLLEKKPGSSEYTPVNLLDGEHDGFGVYYVSNNYYRPVDGLCVAEIQGGSAYFDFSQFDGSILFKEYNGHAGAGMFDDFYPKNENIQKQKEKIKTFVELTSIFGGHLFTLCHKNMDHFTSDENYGYAEGYGYKSHLVQNGVHYITKSIGAVPNNKYQFIYNSNGEYVYDGDLTNTFNEVREQKTDVDWQNEFRRFIGVFTTDEELQNEENGFYYYNSVNSTRKNLDTYLLDYKSLVEYYTICMAFGLTDSVMKNLNIKSFRENGPFYIAFYDMDTSFSRNNNGSYVSPFAFSDYWVDENNNTMIYRDFYPNKGLASQDGLNITIAEDLTYLKNIPDGYDIPSSYLFAIAKYAKIFYENTEDVKYNTNPNYFWYQMRYSESAPLSNAKNFIKNYFGVNLNKINRLFFNANYRFKYLQKTSTGFSSVNLTPFHGRGLASLEDWLNKRFHILDAYFAIKQTAGFGTQTKQWTRSLQYFDLNTSKWEILKNNNLDVNEPSFKSVYGSSFTEQITNNDVYMLNSIFKDNAGQDTQTYDGGTIGSIKVKALDYSPMYFSYPNVVNQYLFIDPNKLYTFVEPQESGKSAIKFGGSISWTYIESMNTLIDESGIINLSAPYLENIRVTRGALKELHLNSAPSLKDIQITSPIATCLLDLNGNSSEGKMFKNITNIDLSGSQCTLIIDNLNVSNVNLSGTINKSAQHEILNCTHLKNINLNGCVAQKVLINPICGTYSTDDSKLSQFGLSYSYENSNKPIRLVSINQSSITNLQLTNTLYDDLAIEIINDDALTDLTLIGFNYIIINGCHNLRNITITDTNDYKVKSLSIKFCYPISTNILNYGTKLPYTYPINVNINGKSSELKNIDLSNLSALEAISFEQTWFIESVTLPNKSITLLDKAFNKVNINYINFADNQCSTDRYLILEETSGIGIFEDSCFTLQGLNNGTNPLPYTLYFKVSDYCTSLSGLFRINKQKETNGMYSANSQIKLNSCITFINTLENKNQLTDISSMFYNQSAIVLNVINEILQDEKALPINENNLFTLSDYQNVTNISNMFALTNIHYLTDKMFSGGEHIVGGNKDINITNFIIPSSPIEITYIKEHAFDPLYNRYNKFYADINQSDSNTALKNTYSLLIVDDNCREIENLKLRNIIVPEDKEVFPNKLTQLIGFNVMNKSIDFENLFDNTENQNLKSILYCLNTFNKDLYNNNNISNINDIHLNKLTQLESFYKSFEFTNNKNHRINIYEYICFDCLEQIYQYNKNIYSKYDTNINIFNFYKELNYDTDWKILWSKIQSFDNISYLFNKCNFISSTSNELIVPTTDNNNNALNIKVTNVDYLFSECSFIVNGEDVGIKLVSESLQALTKITTCKYMFMNSKFDNSNSYVIPANLFNNLSNLKYVNGMFKTITFSTENGYRTYTEGPSKPCYYVANKNGMNEKNYSLKDNNYISQFNSNSDEWNPNFVGYPILPPDIFKNTNIINVSEFIYSSPFEGYLPNLYTNTSIINISNIIWNCKVLPQLYGIATDSSYLYNITLNETLSEVWLYTFIPENYISNTIQNINGLCAFKLLAQLDEYIDVTTQQIPRVYLLCKEFMTDRTDNFNEVDNISPITFVEPISGNPDNDEIILNESKLTNKIHVVNNEYARFTVDNAHVLLNIMIGKCDNIYKEGLDINANYFSKLPAEFVSPIVTSILYGYLFIKDTEITRTNYLPIISIWKRSYLNSDPIDWLISPNAILPKINVYNDPYTYLNQYAPSSEMPENTEIRNENYKNFLFKFNNSQTRTIPILSNQIDGAPSKTDKNAYYSFILQYIILFNNWYTNLSTDGKTLTLFTMGTVMVDNVTNITNQNNFEFKNIYTWQITN